ncbi:MAG TPA: HIT family protein [Pyrinomonadaceae bacterium]|nr:HIT family protein [Pyrinomonadaceae bacterium]
MSVNNCTFCRIAAGVLSSIAVFEDQNSLAFLDHRPLFPGHCLLVPKEHFETLNDLPSQLTGSFFGNVQLLSRAIETAMEAEGTFIAINNRVSQSVPHLHVHVVPRRRKDGLKGFFWPRSKYKSEDEILDVQERIRTVITLLFEKTEPQKNKTHKNLI